MKINKLKLHNFQLFQKEEINFEQFNIISGVNHDDTETSGNGAGKSTILNAIFFALYGSVPGLNLKDLVSIGKLDSFVELEAEHQGKRLYIKREIPSKLTIKLDNKDIQANTLTLQQKIIDDLFCNESFFKMFRTIDTQKGINILSQGIVSLRKTLMSFIDSYFNTIRQNLISKKHDRERFNVDKRLYKFHLSKKRLEILEKGLAKRVEKRNKADNECYEQNKIIMELKTDIQSKIKIGNYKTKEKEKIETSFCPILNKKCKLLEDDTAVETIEKELENLTLDITKIENIVKDEESLLNCYKETYNQISVKVSNAESCLRKLKEAFNFSEYKYTLKDVELYTSSVKVLDTFSGYYINQWLDQLAFIINDLLKSINLEVIFTGDRQFLKIKNGNNELKFDQLSSGQKIFLNAIFKLAILLNKGSTDGIILADEGLSSLDNINLNKFLEICKGLNYQIFLIYQNINIEDGAINNVIVERKEGKSVIQ